MATTGLKLGTGAANTTVLTMAFGTTGNVLINDDTTSSSGAVTAKNAEAYITVSNFGFNSAIPVGANISQVNVSVRATCTTGATSHEAIPVITATLGTVIPDNNTSLTTVTSSNITRPGGGRWTRADLLDGTFTVRLHSLQPNNTTSRTYQFAWVKVEVVYTTGIML